MSSQQVCGVKMLVWTEDACAILVAPRVVPALSSWFRVRLDFVVRLVRDAFRNANAVRRIVKLAVSLACLNLHTGGWCLVPNKQGCSLPVLKHGPRSLLCVHVGRRTMNGV